jgi:hypothetical protein
VPLHTPIMESKLEQPRSVSFASPPSMLLTQGVQVCGPLCHVVSCGARCLAIVLCLFLCL